MKKEQDFNRLTKITPVTDNLSNALTINGKKILTHFLTINAYFG